MTEMSFQVNMFRTYEVRVEGVSFGFIATESGGYSPAFGETFQYDGNTVVLRDGREFTNAPQLRSAIREGWCLLVTDEAPVLRPRSAQIQVRGTTHVGNDRVAKSVLQTQRAEEDVVVTVDDRRRRRETTNEVASRHVALESDEGRTAMASRWDSGDSAVNEIADLLSGEMDEWVRTQDGDEDEDAGGDERDSVKARAEADILSLFAMVEDDEDEALKTRSQARRARRAAGVAPLQRPAASNLPAPTASDFRTLPVDVPEGERMSMPLVREEVMENAGMVVGAVEREKEVELDVAPARPHQAARPAPRFGGSGAIVVDEQRHMGDIALSGGRAPIVLEDSAKVRPSSTESIKVGDVQVGDRRKVARAVVETDQGVAVGRILSPARRDFVADERNTSVSAIQREAEGHHVRIEKFAVEEDEVPARPTATGDVEEARVGDEIEDLLPDAARGPSPVVHRRPEEDPAYAAVRTMIPGFEWNKDRQVKERVAEALKHYKNPPYLKGILAVETEVAREAIKKALADLLAKQKKKGAKKGAKKAG